LPIENPFICQAVSKAAKNPLAIPVPVGQNGYYLFILNLIYLISNNIKAIFEIFTSNKLSPTNAINKRLLLRSTILDAFSD
jgi:hypothetical protein